MKREFEPLAIVCNNGLKQAMSSMLNIERHMRECETFSKKHQQQQQQQNTCEIEAAIVDIETIADQRPIPQNL